MGLVSLRQASKNCFFSLLWEHSKKVPSPQVSYGPSLNIGSTSTLNLDFSAFRIVRKWVASVCKPPVLWCSVLAACWRLHWVVSHWVPWVQSAELPSSLTWCQPRSHGLGPRISWCHLCEDSWNALNRSSQGHLKWSPHGARRNSSHSSTQCSSVWGILKGTGRKSACKWHSASWCAFPHKTWENFFFLKKGF